MRNQTNTTVATSESPTSIRDAFFGDEVMDEKTDDSPFDEPPHSPSTIYRLDGHSFYQSPTRIENGCIVENPSKSILSATISEKLDPRTTSGNTSCEFDDEYEESITGSQSCGEHSDVSSFVSSCQLPGDEFNSRTYHVFGAMVLQFNKLFGLPISSFRSKPLPKPIVWRGYTCFRGNRHDVSGTTTLPCGEEKSGDISFRKSGDQQPNDINAKPFHCNSHIDDATSTSGSTYDDTNAHDYVAATSLQEYLEFMKVSVHHFLKRMIFVEDSDYNISNHGANDFDSIADSLTTFESQQKYEDEIACLDCNVAI
jgi:hypothetical protein